MIKSIRSNKIILDRSSYLVSLLLQYYKFNLYYNSYTIKKKRIFDLYKFVIIFIIYLLLFLSYILQFYILIMLCKLQIQLAQL